MKPFRLTRQFKSRNSVAGVTLLEVLVASAILTVSIGGALTVFQRMTRDVRVARNFASADQVEQLIQSTVFRRTRDYLYDVAAPAKACNDNAMLAADFKSRWAVATPQGVRLNYVNGVLLNQLRLAIPAAAHFSAVSPRLALNGTPAKPRCERDTIVKTSGNFAGENGFYFCLNLSDAGGGALSIDDIRNATPVFAEFRFTTRRADTNAVLTCNEVTDWVYTPPTRRAQLVGTLSYMLYWGSPDANAVKVYRHRTGSTSQTWLW